MLNPQYKSALFGIASAGIALGLLSPVIVILLENQGTEGWITGIVTAMGNVSVILFSNPAGRLIDRYGPKPILLVGTVLTIIGSVGHLFWANLYILFPVKLFTGLGWTFLFVATEVLINQVSTPANRGKMIGTYVVVLSAGIAVGSLLITVMKFGEWIPFAVSSFIMVFVFIYFLMNLENTRTAKPQKKEEKLTFRQMPKTGFMASVYYGMLESSILVAIPIFALRSALPQESVSYLLASFVIGGIFLLYVISNYTDRVPKLMMLSIICFSLTVLYFLPIFTLSFFPLVLVVFSIGGFVPSFYTVGMSYTIDRITPNQLARANGYLALGYGVGAIFGPIYGAIMFDISHNYGYWGISSLLCFVYMVVVVIKNRYNRKATTNSK